MYCTAHSLYSLSGKRFSRLRNDSAAISVVWWIESFASLLHLQFPAIFHSCIPSALGMFDVLIHLSVFPLLQQMEWNPLVIDMSETSVTVG